MKMESLLAGKQFFCREWAFAKLSDILERKRDDGKSGVIIVGSPGCGKTAFLSELCFPTSDYDGQRASLKTRVAAGYFCCPATPSSRKLSHFLKSVSQQLRAKFKPLSLPTQINGTDLKTLLDSWNSAFRSYPTPAERQLFVVDGLELCYDIFGVLSILDFPDWLVPVYSVSRGAKRSREIIKTLDKICQRFPFDDVRKPHVSRDTQQYILRRLESDPPLKAAVTRDTAENLNQLHIKASGCFLYLEVVLDGISRNDMSLRQVREIPGTLSGLWLWLVQRIFGKKLFNSVRSMLELLVAAQRPIKTKTIHSALSLKDKGVTQDDVSKRLQLFGPLLVQKRNGWLPIHNSFLAWCQDVKYSTSRYLCDPLEGHWTLACFHARTCLAIKENLLSTNPEFSDHDYRKETENLVNHIQHCQLSESEASLLLVSVGHEREAVRFMKKLAGNSLHESGCQLTHFSKRGELKEVRRLLAEGTNPNGAQFGLEEPTLVPLVAAARTGNREMVQLIIENQANTLRAECPNKHTFLHAAAQHGHPEVIEMAREMLSFERFGELVGYRDAEGRTPLRLAAWQGNSSVILQLAKYATEHGLDIDQGDLENRSALFAAAYMQHADAVGSLLGAQADPNRHDRDHRTPLNIAALQNQVEICHQLLVAGADVNHADLDGLTALHTACYEQHVDIVQKLIDFGADTDLQDNTGVSPLMASTTTGNIRLVEILLAADPPSSLDFLDQECRNVLSIAAAQGHSELVRKYLDLGLDETHTDNCGWTPLHLVAAENHADCAQILLECGANPDQRDNDGRSALIIAAMEGHLEMVNSLLQAGADPDIRAYDGCSALRYATLENHVDVVKALVDAMADVDSLDNDGRSILYACVLDQNIKMAKLILRLGADPEAEDEEGRRPIHVAAWQGTTEVVKMLLDHGAESDATDSEGRTALQNSAWQNHVEVVRILAEAGASLCHSCQQGATPLCVAAQEGHLETCQLLIKLGANPHQPDACGRTPLRVAEKAGHTHLAKILAETPPTPLQTIKPTNLISTNSTGALQGNSSHTNSSGFVSDQNPDLINSPTNRKRDLEVISSGSEKFSNFAEEIKHLTLPRSLRRSTLKLNEVENTPNQNRQPPRPNLVQKRLINPIAETKNPESFEGSTPSHNSSLSKSVNSKVSKNSHNISSQLNHSLNQSLNISSQSTPSKLASQSSGGTKMRRSASIKGRMTQLSKRVSKISLNFKSEKSSEDSGDLGLSYKRVTATARENLASGINPEVLTSNNIPIEQKLPQWALEQADVTQMEFECDQRTAARLQINDMIHQSLRRPNKR